MTDGSNEIVPGDRVRMILERAAQIDSQGIAGIKYSELQRIAEEAGISSAAFAQAMREELAPHVAAPLPDTGDILSSQPKRKLTLWERFKKSLPYAAIGGVFGLWSAATHDDVGVFLTFIVIWSITAFRIYMNRKERDTTGFQFEVLSMFTGLYMAWIAGGAIDNASLGTGIPAIGTLTAIIGTAAIIVGNPRIEITPRKDAVPST